MGRYFKYECGDDTRYGRSKTERVPQSVNGIWCEKHLEWHPVIRVPAVDLPPKLRARIWGRAAPMVQGEMETSVGTDISPVKVGGN